MRGLSLTTRLERAEAQTRRLADEKKVLERTNRELRTELGIYDSLDPQDARTLRNYLRILDTLATEADANQGLNPSATRSRSATSREPSFTPIYARNLLTQHLDLIASLAESASGWVNTKRDPGPARRQCRSCTHARLLHLTCPRHKEKP